MNYGAGVLADLEAQDKRTEKTLESQMLYLNETGRYNTDEFRLVEEGVQAYQRACTQATAQLGTDLRLRHTG